MRILVLTSRYTATRDIIGEDFGRQTRLFSSLKKLGHDIDFLCADYRKHENKDVKLHGINVMIRPFGLLHFFSFIFSLDNALKNKNYDVMISTSDPLWGAIGYFFANRNKVKFIYDLHDNYETYLTYKMPFLRLLDNHAMKNADAVTTVSKALGEKISPVRENNVFVIQNGVDINLFRPMNRLKCRERLNLPKDAKIIAYAGSIQRLQGLDLLIEAFKMLKKSIKNARLVVAGRFFKGEERHINLSQEGIIYLKSLSQEKVAELINAADVAVVPNPLNSFTEYCFPYKIVEYMACNVPIVATGVGDVKELLSAHKGSICKPNSIQDLAEKIKIQMGKKRVSYRKKAMEFSWDKIAVKLNKVLRCIK